MLAQECEDVVRLLAVELGDPLDECGIVVEGLKVCYGIATDLEELV
jgi:hypothetical protein